MTRPASTTASAPRSRLVSGIPRKSAPRTVVVDDALDFMLKLDTALTLVPYLFAAAYAVKLAVTGTTYGPGQERARRRQLLIGGAAVVYSGYLLYAAGPEYLLLGCLVYAPGTLLFVRARREHGAERVFRPAEAIACVALWFAAALAVVLLVTGVLEV